MSLSDGAARRKDVVTAVFTVQATSQQVCTLEDKFGNLYGEVDGVARSHDLPVSRLAELPRSEFGTTRPAGQLVMLAEVLYTFVLCFVVLTCASSRKNGCGTGNQFYGLAIGFVIIAGGYGAGAISGGAVNQRWPSAGTHQALARTSRLWRQPRV